MSRQSRWSIVAFVVIVLLAGGFVLAQTFFLPEKATKVDEAMPLSMDSTSVVKTGTFSGKTGHHVSGTVKVIQMGNDYYLRFENYEQTQGPDVFVYVTPSPDPDSRSEIDAGLRVLVDGGADGGESTKTGNFNQKLPPNFDPAMYEGVGIWCDNFSVPFGSAVLGPA